MNSGLAAGLAAAAPGAAQGISQGIDAYQQNQGNKAVSAINTQIANDPQMQALQGKAVDATAPPGMDSAANPLSDPSHPAWGILANMTGGTGGPLPGGNGSSAIPTDNNGMVNGAIPVAAQQAQGAPAQMQNGGLVRLNNGSPVVVPQFEKGPAIPTGPNNTVTAPPTARGGMLSMENGGPVPGETPTAGSTGLGQGITPASTDGIMKFDAGGVVPSGFVQQPGISGVPMSGRGAAFVEGLQAGQNLGHNIQQAWLSHEARSANAEGAASAASDTGVADQQPSMLDKAKDAVEGFFHHLHGMTLDDNHKPNSASAVPAGPVGAAPGAAPAQGAVPGSIAPGPTAGQVGPAIPGAPPAGGPAAAAPGAAPVPAQQPGAQPGAASPPGGAGQPSGQSPAGATPQVSPVQQQATMQAAQAAAQDPQTKSGTPDQTPAASGVPHSLTTYQWDESNKKIQQAVRAAAQAGEDPAKVYESLTAMRTAHIQGQVLRQYGAANVALQNGDMDAVKQALSNANYYLPNGQGITFKTATAADVAAAQKINPSDTAKVGDLMYRNPFYGMFGHENDQQFQTVTPMHLQMLGAAALDPRTVNESVTKMYSAQQEAQSNRMKAQGELLTGQGRYGIGQSDLIKAGVDQRLAAGRNYLNVANGEKSEAEAGYWRAKTDTTKAGGQLKITMNDYNKASQEAIAAVRNNVQGKPRVEQPMITDPKTGKQVPNLSPAAGHSIPNAGQVPSLYQNMGANTQNKVENLSAQLAGANIGMVPPQEAGDLAARIVHWEEGGSKSTHLDPATHTQQPDVILDGKSNSVHVWTGNGYKSIWATPNLDTSGGGGKDEALPTGGSNGGAGENSATNDFPNA